MNIAVLKTKQGEKSVSDEQIIAAMAEFDQRYRDIEDCTGRLYAVEANGKQYPPKRILAIATGVPTSEFYGGGPTNDIFRNLGYHVSKAQSYMSLSAAQANAAEQSRLQLPVPDVNGLVEILFAQRWSSLHSDYAKLADSQYPGVYVLSYSAVNLVGTLVTEESIYYVGVSHVGVRRRLRQFIVGLEDNGHHSAAMRFFPL